MARAVATFRPGTASMNSNFGCSRRASSAIELASFKIDRFRSKLS